MVEAGSVGREGEWPSHPVQASLEGGVPTASPVSTAHAHYTVHPYPYFLGFAVDVDRHRNLKLV
ncbi:hypothetical protein E2C01_031540 [Portunus trituberculatus]|uniref:Uncharacterized protein n=1 Tax=Portunus trituberculatus TaxID=210409 RepID=A0A5B7EYD9_PORTR|nr:hypothetical protein [Portunus trituberculatus]